jgi:hypothetical protein
LFQFYKLVYPKLISRLPKPFQLIKGQRQDETPAHTALREAFVNALIHSDYSAPGSIIIECRAESFTFTNPGTLLVTLSQFYNGGISQCRNTNIQKMFLMIGSAEKAGSGVSKIISGWVSAHWRRPYVTIATDPDRVILEMPMFSVIPENTLSELKKLFGESVEALGKDELAALAVCHIEGDVTNSKLQYNIDKHKSDITKLLQDLCKNGYLVSENKSRWTTYHLNTDFNSNSHYPKNDDSLNDDSSNNASSIKLMSDKGLVNNSNESKLNDDTSNNDTSIIKSITKLQSQIIEACSGEYISIEEIAEKVNRSNSHLKNKIVPDMVKEGLLIRLHTKITHPDQKYISKK